MHNLKVLALLASVAAALAGASGCCNRPLFGGGSASPYSYNYGPQYYAQQVAPPVQPMQPMQPMQQMQPMGGVQPVPMMQPVQQVQYMQQPYCVPCPQYCVPCE